MSHNTIPTPSAPSPVTSNQQPSTDPSLTTAPHSSQKMAPGPFCCYGALPSTLRYAIHLLPNTIIHNPLSSKGATALLASFLAHLVKDGKAVPTSVPEGISPLFYAIIQVKKIPFLDQASTGPGAGTANRRTATSSASSSLSFISSPAAPQTRAQLRASGQSPPRRQPGTKSNATSYLTSSLPTTPIPTLSTVYFVPIEKSGSATALDQNSLLFSRGFREITTREAMESLRAFFPETRILIGDGETWTQRQGVERFWCTEHGVRWELRVWIREST